VDGSEARATILKGLEGERFELFTLAARVEELTHV
jgi:hypothetical protein